MINSITHIERNETPRAEQLTLLSVPTDTERTLTTSPVHARFQLSKTTRERGLAHVAEIRAQLAAAKAQREASNVVALPPRTRTAA